VPTPFITTATLSALVERMISRSSHTWFTNELMTCRSPGCSTEYLTERPRRLSGRSLGPTLRRELQWC
jgi:hypothetical protein